MKGENDDNVTRTGISLDKSLLKQFDDFIKKRGYKNRSKAISDAIRHFMAEYSWENLEGEVIGVISFIYNHEVRGLSDELTDIEHEYVEVIKSSTHIHLDKQHCLEVVVSIGDSRKIANLAKKLMTRKGVKHLRVITV